MDEGVNAISDDLVWTRDWLLDFLSTFEGYDVWGQPWQCRRVRSLDLDDAVGC